MTFTYGSVCSGIEGIGHGLEQDPDWECAWQIEIDPKCTKVLEKHWPDVPRFGDVSAVKAADLEKVDLIVGGTPCQGLSAAGKGAGLTDDRSVLFYEFIRLAKDLQPSWLLFENVPGMLSTNNGKDFELVLQAFNDAGFVPDPALLDAQEFGLAQRRKRVFIACANRREVDFDERALPWEGARPIRMKKALKSSRAECFAGVLSVQHPIERVALRDVLEPYGSHLEKYFLSPKACAGILRRAERRGRSLPDGLKEALQATIDGRTTVSPDAFTSRDTAAALTSTGVGTCGADDNQAQAGHFVGYPDPGHSLLAVPHGPRYDYESETVVYSLYPESGTEAPLHARATEVAQTLATAEAKQSERGTVVARTFRKVHRAMSKEDYETWAEDDITNTLNVHDVGDVFSTQVVVPPHGYVRRLTPLECARLQGFPDDWLDLTPPLSDSVKYKMFGNAVATPVAGWAGSRIKHLLKA